MSNENKKTTNLPKTNNQKSCVATGNSGSSVVGSNSLVSKAMNQSSGLFGKALRQASKSYF